MNRMKKFRQIVLVSMGVGLLAAPVLGKGPKPSWRPGTIGGDIVSDTDRDGNPDPVPLGDFVFVDGLWLSEDLLRASEDRIAAYIDNDPFDQVPGWQTTVVGKPAPTYFPSGYPTESHAFYSGYLRLILYEKQHSARIDFLFSPCGSCRPPNWFTEDPPVGVDGEGEPLFFLDQWGSLDCSEWSQDTPCPFELLIVNATYAEVDGSLTLSDSIASGADIFLSDFTLGPVCDAEVEQEWCVEMLDDLGSAYPLGITPEDDDGPAFNEITITFVPDSGGSETGDQCIDGIDNDGDGATDCADSDCRRVKACR